MNLYIWFKKTLTCDIILFLWKLKCNVWAVVDRVGFPIISELVFWFTPFEGYLGITLKPQMMAGWQGICVNEKQITIKQSTWSTLMEICYECCPPAVYLYILLAKEWQQALRGIKVKVEPVNNWKSKHNVVLFILKKVTFPINFCALLPFLLNYSYVFKEDSRLILGCTLVCMSIWEPV